MHPKICSDAYIALCNEDDLVGLVLKLTGGFVSPASIRAQIAHAKKRAGVAGEHAETSSQPQKGEK